MSKRSKRKRNARRATNGVAAVPSGDLRIVAKMPGALMVRRDYPTGVPDTHTARSAHLHAAADSPAFVMIPSAEKQALFDSLTKTLRRSVYHRVRFAEVRAELDRRRANLPGPVFWDEFVEILHFELQAFCGAARMMLDEIMYIAARRHGAPPNKARRKPWETADLLKEPLPPECQVPEVLVARKRIDWFELLNAYRNSFFHHGWRHGTGHYSVEDQGRAAKNPAANALIVPDRRSLGGRSKPHERTYNDGTTVDDVMALASQGLDGLLSELCEASWGTPEPAPGRIPRPEQPNMIVSLVSPVVFGVHDLLLVPFFSTEAAARAFATPDGQVELVRVPVASSVVGRPAVSFSLKGLSTAINTFGRPHAGKLRVLIDPVVADASWRAITCAGALDVDIAEIEARPVDPISVVVERGDHVFVWAGEDARSWER